MNRIKRLFIAVKEVLESTGADLNRDLTHPDKEK